MVHVECYFGWSPYSWKHDVIVLSYFLHLSSSMKFGPGDGVYMLTLNFYFHFDSQNVSMANSNHVWHWCKGSIHGLIWFHHSINSRTHCCNSAYHRIICLLTIGPSASTVSMYFCRKRHREIGPLASGKCLVMKEIQCIQFFAVIQIQIFE